MKKLLLSLLIWLWLTSFGMNISYAEDEPFWLDSIVNDMESSSSSSSATSSSEELWGLQKALWTFLNLFYFNFYNEFLNGFFWSIPKVWSEFVSKSSGLLWWLAIAMSIITLLIYLFADAKWWEEWEEWKHDLRTVIVELIKSIRNWEKTWNEKTLQIMLFLMIVVSIFILTLLISFLFTKLIVKWWMVMMFYNLIVWIVWFSMIFLVIKWIYINWLVDTYLSDNITREETLKKGVVYLWFIVIWIVLAYSILDWLKTTLSGW